MRSSNSKKNRQILMAALAAATAATSVCQMASAANVTWTGGGANGSWSLPANWIPTAAVANDALFFAGTTNLSTFNDLNAGDTYAGITFNAGAGAFTLAGNQLAL